MIAVIDYGAGNIRSVVNAITYLGYRVKITSSPDEIYAAETVILPGVGETGEAMDTLKSQNLDTVIRKIIAEDRPFLGICLGMQALFTATEEGGGNECLGVLPGTVRKLPPGDKIPHMGWNQVKQKISHPVFEGVPDGSDFYFVHSYYADPTESSFVAGETDYTTTFCSAVARGNLVAVQFHPERSGKVGLKIYDNFLKNAGKH